MYPSHFNYYKFLLFHYFLASSKAGIHMIMFYPHMITIDLLKFYIIIVIFIVIVIIILKFQQKTL